MRIPSTDWNRTFGVVVVGMQRIVAVQPILRARELPSRVTSGKRTRGLTRGYTGADREALREAGDIDRSVGHDRSRHVHETLPAES